MVKKIKKKIKITANTRYVIPMVLAASPQFQPNRSRTFLLSAFDPPGKMTRFFQEHFSLTMVAADRFVTVREFSSWLGSIRPSLLMKEGLNTGCLAFPPFSGPAEMPGIVLLPLLGLGSEAEWEDAKEDFSEGFSEIIATRFKSHVEPELGIVPGVDRFVWMGPAGVQDCNAIILYLHGRASDECRMAGWPEPSLFHLLDFKSFEGKNFKFPVSY